MLSFNMEKETRKKRRIGMQWLVGIIANSLLFSYELQAGWMSPMGRKLQSQASPTGHPLSANILGWVASVMPITALVFVPVFSFLADKFGRKPCILIMTMLQAACWLIKLFFTKTGSVALMIARLCSGMAAGGCFSVIPMYNKEISQDNIRGVMGSLLIFSCNSGLLVIYTLGANLEYYTVLYIVVGLPFLSFILMLSLCPESPDYLVKIEKFDEAVKIMALLRGLDTDDTSIQNEVNAMKKSIEYYKTLPNLSMVVILKDVAWRKAFILAIILISIQSFSGNFALVSYGANILVASGAHLNAELMTITFPAVMMTGSIVSMCVVERVGRKVILIIAYLVSAAALACLALALQLPGIAPAWLLLTAILISMFAFAGGVMPLPYIVMSELFNIQIRAKLIGIVLTYAWSLTFAQVAAFAPVTAALGMHAFFYCFSAVHLLGVAALLVLMPETRGKSVEQLEAELRKK